MHVGVRRRMGMVGGATLCLVLLGATVSDRGLPSAAAAVTCDKIAAVAGSDSASGDVQHPYATVGHLLDNLSNGQTGCLRAGNYYGELVDPVGSPGYRLTTIEVPNITLTSYPGERARLNNRLWVNANGVTVSDLDLNGTNSNTDAASLTVAGEQGGPAITGVRLLDNDITNDNQRICVNVGAAGWGRATGTLIEGNRIHDCGWYEYPKDAIDPPPDRAFTGHWNQDHGIYVGAADGTVIRNNVIYDNAYRGIQLYPDSQGTLVSGNVLDNNGEGVSFGGVLASYSDGNTVEENVLTWASERWNVEHSYEKCPPDPQIPPCVAPPWPTENLVQRNCLVANNQDADLGSRAWYNTNNGVRHPDDPTAPYLAINDQLEPNHNYLFPDATDLYRDRLSKDFHLASAACESGLGADPAEGAERWTAVRAISEVDQNAGFSRAAIGGDGTEALIWEEAASSHAVTAAVRQPKAPNLASPDAAPWTVEKISGAPDAYDGRIGVDSAGNVVAIWRQSDGLNWRLYASSRSSSSGTWSAPSAVSAAGIDISDPELAVASNGTAAAIWRGSNGIVARAQAAVLSTAGTWGSPTNLSGAASNASEPDIGIGAGGRAFAVWRYSSAKEIVRARIRPPGASWGAVTTLSNGAQDAYEPDVAVGATDHAVAVWRRYNGSRWVVQSSSSTGGAWSASAGLSNASEDSITPAVGVASNGSAVAVFRRWNGSNWIVQGNTRPSGGSFASSGTNLSAPGDDAIEPQIGVGAHGSAIATWKRSDPSVGYERIQARRRDSGIWGSVANLSTAGFVAAPPPTLFAADAPAVAVGEHGFGLAAWDQLNTCPSCGEHRVQYANFFP